MPLTLTWIIVGLRLEYFWRSSGCGGADFGVDY